MRSLLLLLGCVLGCADPCVDGVCEDTSATQALPGPCEGAYASADYRDHCVYSYDGTRLAHVDCTYAEGATTGTETTTYGEDGSIHGIRLQDDGVVDTDGTWTFDPAHVTYDVTRFAQHAVWTYDRATFAFLPTDPGDRPFPQAELGLQRIETDELDGLKHVSTFTWTTDGNQLTRTVGHIVDTFVVDGQHRIVTWEHGQPEPFVPDQHRYAYQGDHLTRHAISSEITVEEFQTATYHYDHGGNLAGFSADETGGDSGYQAAFSYACW